MSELAGAFAPVESLKLLLMRLQEYSIFAIENVRALTSVIRYRRDTMEQMYLIGCMR